MHIMEGYLPAKYCVAWGVVCLPFLIAGFISLKNKVKEIEKFNADRNVRERLIFVISRYDYLLCYRELFAYDR